MKLLNSLSLNMIAVFPATITVEEISKGRVSAMLAIDGIHSVVGHADTAAVFQRELGIVVDCNRETIALTRGEKVIIGQYRGPRLAEGATSLPEGATIQWLLVKVQ